MGGAAGAGICFSASLAADSGPGPVVVEKGCTARRRACFLRLQSPTSGLAGGGGGRERSWTGSSPRLPPPTSNQARRRRRRGSLRDGPARRERHRRSTYCCCGSPPPPDYCWTYIRLVLYLYTFGLRRCADSTTPFYLPVSGGLAAGVRGKRDPRCCFYHPPWQPLGWRLGWQDRCWTGSLLSTPPAADFGPGPEAATEGCAAGQGIALYASRRLRARPGGCAGGALSWTGSLLSTPPAADFGPGPGPEGAAAGCAAGQEIALYASRRRLRARPGWGGGGPRSWTQMFLSTPLAADFRPRSDGAAEGRAALARSLIFYYKKLFYFNTATSRREAQLCSVTGPYTI